MVDTSLMEAAIQQTYWQSAIYLATGENPGPRARRTSSPRPTRLSRPRNGWIQRGRRQPGELGAHREGHRPRGPACRPALRHQRRPDEAPGRAHAAHRRAHEGAPFGPLDPRARVRRRAVGPINRIGEHAGRPQVAAREMVVEGRPPKAGRDQGAGAADQVLGHAGLSITRAAPLLGQHTREILASLGYDDAAIDRLAASGAVALS